MGSEFSKQSLRLILPACDRCKIPSIFWQQKAKCGGHKQCATQNTEGNGDTMRPALQYSDDGRAKITADIAERIHQAYDRAGGRARHRLRGNGKERRQSGKWPRDGQAQERIGKPEGMSLEQNARDEGQCRSRHK